VIELGLNHQKSTGLKVGTHYLYLAFFSALLSNPFSQLGGLLFSALAFQQALILIFTDLQFSITKVNLSGFPFTSLIPINGSKATLQ
jgi:hypothetical protein